MLNLLFATVVAATLSQKPGPAATHPTPPPNALNETLYSRHARRLVRAYLRLRLRELHEQRLDAIRRVIERELPVEALFATPPPGRR